MNKSNILIFEPYPFNRIGGNLRTQIYIMEFVNKEKFHLVFPEDVEPEDGKISTASPIGKALMGKQEGDEVIISLPDQRVEYEVIRILTVHDNIEVDKE